MDNKNIQSIGTVAKSTCPALVLVVLWTFTFYALQTGYGVLFNGIELGQKVEIGSITNNAEVISSCIYRYTKIDNSKTSMYEYVIYNSQVQEITAPSNMFTIVRNRPWHEEMVNFKTYKIKNAYLPLPEKERKRLQILTYRVKNDKTFSVYYFICIPIYFLGIFLFNRKTKGMKIKERIIPGTLYILLFLGLSFLSYKVAIIM